jgi:hypothetical protein
VQILADRFYGVRNLESAKMLSMGERVANGMSLVQLYLILKNATMLKRAKFWINLHHGRYLGCCGTPYLSLSLSSICGCLVC